MDFKIFDTLLEAVFVINKDKAILYCNEPAALLCEMSVRKLSRGQIFDQVLKFEEPPNFLRTLQFVEDASPYQEIGFSSTDGKTGKAQLTCQLYGEVNGGPAWLIFFRDVTLEETLQKKYRAELEQVQHYSKNLERMVDERTAEIKKLNQTITALLDSLGQGFFIFDQSATCLNVHSKACLTTIESSPAGRKLWDVLKMDLSQVPGLENWVTTIFSEMLPFEDLSPLGPTAFPHSQGRHIDLAYYPLRNNDSQIEGVVVVATDITNLVEARKEADVERAHAKMILTLVKNKRQVANFIREAQEIIAALTKELAKGSHFDPENAFRLLHTLKGGSASFSIKDIADKCHEAETCLSALGRDPTVVEKFEQLKTLSAQIADGFTRFQEENRMIIGDREKLTERWIETPLSQILSFYQSLAATAPNLGDAFAKQFFMEPVLGFFSHYNEVVQNVAETQSKVVAPLAFHGETLKVLPEHYEGLFSTFIHCFRNAVDHGIEEPHERESAGKSITGHIEIHFRRTTEGAKDQLLIQVKDDGRGIDPEKIRAKLKSLGKDPTQESDEQVIQHIFDSQFSTKSTVTDISGRGVGMDAILFAANRLGGKAWVESVLGQGTTLSVQVPYLKEMPDSFKKAA